MTIEHFTQLKASIDETSPDGTIYGIAARYGISVPRGPGLSELLSPGMFRAQMKAPNRVVILFQHNDESPIGRVQEFQDSDTVLKFKAKISDNEDLPDARKARALLKEGIIDEMSVGFEWQTWEEKIENDNLTIVHTKARLRELSVVVFGALGREARVLTVANDNAANARRALLRARMAGLTA